MDLKVHRMYWTSITRPLRNILPVETHVILPYASADVVHPQEMEPFAVAYL
jgi:hypothetical protein